MGCALTGGASGRSANQLLYALALARFCLDQRSFCAAAMRARPSGEMTRLAGRARGLGATSPLLRGLRETLVAAAPDIRSRASVKRLISPSMWRRISSVVIATECISLLAKEALDGFQDANKTEELHLVEGSWLAYLLRSTWTRRRARRNSQAVQRQVVGLVMRALSAAHGASGGGPGSSGHVGFRS